MSELDWLSDAAWAVLEPHLPRDRPGAPRVSDRRVISGILHVLRSGCRWKDCPPEFGPATTIYNRHNRWSAQGSGPSCSRAWWRPGTSRTSSASTAPTSRRIAPRPGQRMDAVS